LINAVKVAYLQFVYYIMYNWRKIFATFCAFCAIAITVFAGDGADSGYSPYSKFGIGTLNHKGTAYNNTMGGVGVASRDNRYINALNPASVTARDSLSFMVDFDVSQDNRYFQQGDIKSVDNTFNVSGFMFSFPIWKSSAMMVGITPFSSVGYDFAMKLQDPSYYQTIGYTGNISDAYTGDGSIYNIFVAGGVTFFKRLSIGAQFDYYFGNLSKNYTRYFSSSSYRSIYTSDVLVIEGFGGKFGIQYEQPFGRSKLILGATYRLKTNLIGSSEQMTYAMQSEVADTLSYAKQDIKDTGVNIPSEIGIGLSYRHKNQWSAEFNYTHSDWNNSGMGSTLGFKAKGFSTTTSDSFNAGFEITPNRGDIRYYMKRISYRIGGYYTMEHYCLNDTQINSMALTLGVTLPVFRWFNGITLGMELGQRGALNDDLIRERFVNFSIAFNLFDIWFVKPSYE